MSKAEEFGFFLTRTFATTKQRKRAWPFVPGKYFVHDPRAPVAVTTLGSVDLAREVSEAEPEGLCIVGKVETENIGIEKIIKNVLSNRAIRVLICAGKEPPKHMTGATMIALFQGGMDEQHRIPGSPGMRPVLPNTSTAEVDHFRSHIEPIDMIGETDVATICARVTEIADDIRPFEGEAIDAAEVAHIDEVESLVAGTYDPKYIKLDKAGYFVVNIEGERIVVEHYDYKENLLRNIEGRDARNLYLTLIERGWITRVDHAAYVGKELAKAELSILHGFEYLQDGA